MAERPEKKRRVEVKSTYSARQVEKLRTEAKAQKLFKKLRYSQYGDLPQDDKDMSAYASVISDRGDTSALTAPSVADYESRPYWQKRGMLLQAQHLMDARKPNVDRGMLFYHNQKARTLQRTMNELDQAAETTYDAVQNPFGTELPHELTDIVMKMLGNGFARNGGCVTPGMKKGFF